MVYTDSESKILKCCRSGGFESFGVYFGILNVFGPSTIFSRKLYQSLGGFREDFHFCMDTEYWWRIANSGIQYERIPVYLWALRLHEGAKTAAVVTQGQSARPPRMVEENEAYREMYFSDVSEGCKRRGVLLLRLWRVLNFSYIKSYLDTVRCRGELVSSIRNGQS